RQLVELARPMRVTYHRAFDLSSDLLGSLRALQTTGVDCLLTSGGSQTASEGAKVLKELVSAAHTDLSIMAGGGIEDHNVAALIEQTGVREIHASLRDAYPSPMRYQNRAVSMGTAKGLEYQRFVTSEDKVRNLLLAARAAEARASSGFVD